MAADSSRHPVLRPQRAHHDPISLPKGISRQRSLPDQDLAGIWDSIILDKSLKDQLLCQAVLNFQVRGRVSRTALPLHGVILLVGEPGTGKTSLARGLADRTAQTLKGAKFSLLEVEPHTLTSSAMGSTQRAVTELFAQAISEAALNGPTIVLLDEVETLAADRSKLSLEANPVDVHRATDAVLVQLDELAERHPQLLFLATSNFPQAVDAAFKSRCDLVAEIPLPDAAACEAILRDCLGGVAAVYPSLRELVDDSKFALAAAACVGLDGRAIRKVVANAMAARKETALDPNRTTAGDLLEAATRAATARNAKRSGK